MALLVRRYKQGSGIGTKIDPFDDMMGLVDSFTSHEFLTDILRTRHGLAAAEAAARAKLIFPHVQAAIQLIHQSENGPSNVCFLPLYYALLNFAKACILVGPHYQDLPKNRWHGATYPGHSKDSHNLLTEQIVLKGGGAIPLFYRTLTGKLLPKDRTVRMSDVYPFIVDACAEYEIVTGTPSRLVQISFTFNSNPDGTSVPKATVKLAPHKVNVKLAQLRALVGYKQDPANPLAFLGPKFATGNDDQFRSNLRPYLLFDENDYTYTPICSKQMLLPEELPILLMFFHLSNVVRYKPEFLAKIRNSRYWPILTGARRHCILKSLIRFWSFVSNRGMFISHM